MEKNSLSQALKAVPFRNIVLPALILNLIVIGTVVALQKRLPPVVPLFYGQPVGEGQLAPSFWLMLPAVVSVILIAVNLGLTKLVEDNFLQKALAGAVVATTTLSAITIIKIMFLVGNLPR